ncbi:hypothetical protein AKJ63_01915 [candidate division MSBL1 archaeon SCGC-AAA259D18]|uniref:Uncharacterized protein n=1 Tax=candidate division MSBL1 archaeon SCGC-AAA259D18 TaxID=1698262 RepID=A0A133UA69_9EURY|nr:hypothetical protein AKJ63_01915 [candidate division MSBL1 archaeon SCGC-AAA259D18]
MSSIIKKGRIFILWVLTHLLFFGTLIIFGKVTNNTNLSAFYLVFIARKIAKRRILLEGCI